MPISGMEDTTLWLAVLWDRSQIEQGASSPGHAIDAISPTLIAIEDGNDA